MTGCSFCRQPLPSQCFVVPRGGVVYTVCPVCFERESKLENIKQAAITAVQHFREAAEESWFDLQQKEHEDVLALAAECQPWWDRVCASFTKWDSALR